MVSSTSIKDTHLHIPKAIVYTAVSIIAAAGLIEGLEKYIDTPEGGKAFYKNVSQHSLAAKVAGKYLKADDIFVEIRQGGIGRFGVQPEYLIVTTPEEIPQAIKELKATFPETYLKTNVILSSQHYLPLQKAKGRVVVGDMVMRSHVGDNGKRGKEKKLIGSPDYSTFRERLSNFYKSTLFGERIEYRDVRERK